MLMREMEELLGVVMGMRNVFKRRNSLVISAT